MFLQTAVNCVNAFGVDPAERLAYILDHNSSKAQGVLKTIADALVETAAFRQFRMGGLTWARAKDVPHLQAADILAYEMAKLTRPRRSRENLLGHQSSRYSGTHLDRDKLIEVFGRQRP